MERGTDFPNTVLVPEGFDDGGVPSVCRVRERVSEGSSVNLTSLISPAKRASCHLVLGCQPSGSSSTNRRPTGRCADCFTASTQEFARLCAPQFRILLIAIC